MPSWVCCRCQSSCQGTAVDVGCTNWGCDHIRCPSCPVEASDALQYDSDSDSVSICGEDACNIPPASHTLRPASPLDQLPVAGLSTPTFTVLDHNGVKPIPAPKLNTLQRDIPLTQSDFAPSNPTFAPSALAHHNAGPTQRGETYVWYCCYCNDGPNGYGVVYGCPMCGRLKCDNCRVEVVKN
ncbi:hypothetical protein BCR34DRAFT_53147 [Clohesyomyces aquaticus]|uniref:Uncharacterized protein n=1 Tax=Clohesyomyces aquaticus TaxID=1231657 RepID=A0A1Y2A5N7_9PLEO|nr:hypothetical protein BCR34DRAFT_53147 [Clohesyomyces aquaticus]